MKNERIPSVGNAHGCKIKKCCASCQHKCIECDGTRVCTLTMQQVQQNIKCKKWKMADSLKNAGNNGGKVKCKEYLIYVQEIRNNITKQERKTLEEIRQMFTEKFGSIYVME